ncbi:TonB-dependent receptor domain-containing protein [Bordetella tumulicola]|uniref:TonB-dependent receptor domain-containing protein n=1 Tax=Bordetella tumulicola TaxID=1649133 RepID=UPI0039F06721
MDREVTPYVGVIYDLEDNLSLYGSYSEIFVPQSAYDAGGSLLNPMTGEDYDAGLKGEYYGDPRNVMVSLTARM